MFNKSPAVDTIEQHKSSMDSMKAFIDLVNDPEKVKAAHEIVRKEHTLTEEQAKKYKEALEFSEKYSDLATTYNQHVEALEKAEKEHADAVTAHNDKIKEDSGALDERKEALAAGEHQLAIDRKKLEDDTKEQESKYSELRTPIDDDIEQNRKDKEANEKERIRLEKLAKKLQKKDAKVLAAINDEPEETEEAA